MRVRALFGRNIFRVAIFVAVVILVFVVLRPRIDWQLALASLSQINWGLLVLAILSVPCQIFARAARWKILVGRSSQTGYWDYLRAVAISFMAIVFLPGSGEVSRIVVMKKRSTLPLGYIGGTVLIEKLVDTSLLIGCLAILLLTSGSASGFAPLTTVASSAVAVGVLLGAAAVLAPRFGGRLKDRLERFSNLPLAPRAIGLIDGALEGMRALGAGGVKHAAATLAASLVVLAAGIAPYSLVLAAFGLNLPAFAPLLLITAVNLGMAVPTVPGAVGTLQAVVAGALALMSIEVERGLAFGAVLHVVLFGPLLAMGLIATFAESIPLGRFGELATKPEVRIGER